MTLRDRFTTNAIVKWLRKIQFRLRSKDRGYRLVKNEDDSYSIDSNHFMLGDPYCEFHSASATVSLHCDAIEDRIFNNSEASSELSNNVFSLVLWNLPRKQDNPVPTLLKISQLNSFLRANAINSMKHIEIESLYVVAEEQNIETVFKVEVQVNGRMEILKSSGTLDVFESARSAFTTALFILRYFNCSKTDFGVRMDCPVPVEITYMKFPGLTKFQRVKHIHWNYRAPRQLLGLLSAGAVLF